MHCNRGVGERNPNVNVGEHSHSGIQLPALTQFQKGNKQMISMDLHIKGTVHRTIQEHSTTV